MSIFLNRDKMWFGTEEKMGWIETPQTGADVSPEGFGASATLQNGGGYERNSWASHKVHQFSWGDATTPQIASKIHAYRNGTYGRGLIHFIDPMYYDTNILPKHWADPSMAIDYEAPSLISGVEPTFTPTPSNPNDLPSRTTIYSVPAGYDASVAGDELLIPTPEGTSVLIGAVYSGTTADMYIQYPGGAKTHLPSVAIGATDLHPFTFAVPSGYPWAKIGIRSTGATSDISITALSVRIAVHASDVASLKSGPWTSGEGNTGCQFRGSPTLVNYNGVNGGQVGLACTLVETGGWR